MVDGRGRGVVQRDPGLPLRLSGPPRVLPAHDPSAEGPPQARDRQDPAEPRGRELLDRIADRQGREVLPASVPVPLSRRPVAEVGHPQRPQGRLAGDLPMTSGYEPTVSVVVPVYNA